MAVDSSEYWNGLWEAGNIKWHLPTVSPHLKKNWLRFCPDSLNSKKVLVPLCGKTLDLEWLYVERKCIVVGCDLSEKAFLQFAEEHPELKIRKKQVTFRNGQQFTLFCTPDERLRLYVCDFFIMTQSPESSFNLVWDANALVAVEPVLRQKYMEVILNVSTSNVRWLLQTYDYPPEQHNSHPYSFSDADLKALFDGSFHFEILSREEVVNPAFAKTDCFLRMVLLTRNTSN
ncbi:unnamed protein product [Calicophoron daubneyi]|uniref:thiopurine S-methyltransferase n=1 Tax=Calicophoron daubneyi TaxID=300641 RepID=A0AAV2TA80_CALDB